MKPKRISLYQREKLKKMFPMTKEEREKMQILKEERKENIVTSLIILILVVFTITMIFILYLMINYKW